LQRCFLSSYLFQTPPLVASPPNSPLQSFFKRLSLIFFCIAPLPQHPCSFIHLFVICFYSLVRFPLEWFAQIIFLIFSLPSFLFFAPNFLFFCLPPSIPPAQSTPDQTFSLSFFLFSSLVVDRPRFFFLLGFFEVLIPLSPNGSLVSSPFDFLFRMTCSFFFFFRVFRSQRIPLL